ncbi:alpha/beta fold hydrolase [Ideonella alba]|uniref:Proline iminopeptidase n=1 Tax=Ideonella alba TaxID=2824118 RepID=A0A940YEN7_9BURK|nr:alpha/beta fold hydrolase [Ideonella alba]MBQ0933175.1 alpha/beta fold hydrolase [Ideonella alba]
MALLPTLAPLLLATLATTASAAPSLPLTPCRLSNVPQEARCGTLQRPLDPAQPQGRQITLQVALIPALARNARQDPVVFVAGGPGQSAVDLAGHAMALFPRLLNRRPLLLVDQRGTGRSAPLYCDDRVPPTRPLAELVDARRLPSELAACRQRLQQLPHGDLRHYTTTVASADLEAVRQALGLGPLNLFGGSYGTRAALDYLRQYPGSVRRLLLDGVAPPDMVLMRSMPTDQRATLDALLASAEPQRPGLTQRWQALLAAPARDWPVRHPFSGRDETLRVDGALLASLVRPALYQPAAAAALPSAIDRAAAGDLGPLLALATPGPSPSGRPGLAQGQHFSVVCSEDAPLLDTQPAAPSPDPAGTEALYRRICADWPRASVPPDFYRLPLSPVPVLLMSGGQDPATPPRHAQRVLQALGPKAVHALVPQAGHGVSSLGCLRELMHRFIDADDDTAALAAAREGADCAKDVPRPTPWRALSETAP